MKTWEQPLASVEKFVANEYVAACWTVKCNVVGPDAIDKKAGVTHRAQFCGAGDHYVIALADDNRTPVSMTEIQTDKLGDLPCTLYTDASFTVVKDITSVKRNEHLYWTTSYGDKTWHHDGNVTGTDNHS